jgi:hypothetical protein
MLLISSLHFLLYQKSKSDGHPHLQTHRNRSQKDSPEEAKLYHAVNLRMSTGGPIFNDLISYKL